ncbi:MAG: hypothetical protein ACN4GM_10080 [Gammaproteobacteria bacterium]
MDDAEHNGITKSSKMLVLEVRTILDVLIGLLGGEGDVIEDLSKQELIHFLNMARSRLDTLSSKLGQRNSDNPPIK